MYCPDTWEPKPSNDEFRFEDRKVLNQLLESKKLTDKQHEALRRLLASWDYVRN